MKNFILITATLLSSTMVFAAAAPAKYVGKLGMVQGQVTLNDRPTKSGIDVPEGAVIEVKKGQATLLLGKGSVIHLAADSKMVVNQFGVSAAGEEGGELDLKYGRTRALILNQGNEKKDIKIKARAATMGVRGTEIFISAPQEPNKPVSFFTLEGKAEVKVPGVEIPKTVNQNEGVVTSGVAPTQGSGSGAGAANGQATGPAAGSASGPAAAAAVQSVSVTAEQVRTEVQNSGLTPPPIKTAQDVANVAASGQTGQPTGPTLQSPNKVNPGFADFGTAGGVPAQQFNPGADTVRQVTIQPTFESVGQ